METKVNWIHFTDLHYGMRNQQKTWPNVREELKEDLSRLSATIGSIDLVFLTGDVVQSGKKQEFELVEEQLLQIHDHISSFGNSPKWLVIPGNHDLERPNNSGSVVLASKYWDSEEAYRDAFWEKANHDLRKSVSRAFANYLNWINVTTLPIISAKKGCLPGDFSTVYEKEEKRIGIVGLNSTFLQLAGGDYSKHLAISPSQLSNCCDPDPALWSQQNDLNVLLTHQPSSWFCDSAITEYKADIMVPGRFAIHLCGHLHEPFTEATRIGGGAERFSHQTASLFGLEKFGEPPTEQRIHGYSIGEWSFTDSNISERIFPRVLARKQDGSLKLEADSSYSLHDDSAIHRANLPSPRQEPPQNSEESEEGGDAEAADIKKTLAGFLKPEGSAEIAAKIPRFRKPAGPQHFAVRSDERAAARANIHSKRYSWIIADWGMGTHEFLTTVFSSGDSDEVSASDSHLHVYSLQCEEAESAEALMDQTQKQFGLTISEFVANISPVKNPCLILDRISPKIVLGPEIDKLQNVIDSLLDYLPQLSIAIVSRSQPISEISAVKLSHLDIPDTRQYLEAAPNFEPEILKPEFVEKVHEASDGLPTHLDRILSKVTVASLDAILEEEDTAAYATGTDGHAQIQKGLFHALEIAKKRDIENGSNCLLLLRILSILQYGETIERLKHFWKTINLYPIDAKLLQELSLVETISLVQNSPVIRANPGDSPIGVLSPKLLRVPKQVRDATLATTPSETAREIIHFVTFTPEAVQQIS